MNASSVLCVHRRFRHISVVSSAHRLWGSLVSLSSTSNIPCPLRSLASMSMLRNETGAFTVVTEAADPHHLRAFLDPSLKLVMLLLSVFIRRAYRSRLNFVDARGSFRLSSYPIDGPEELSRSTSTMVFLLSASFSFFFHCFHTKPFPKQIFCWKLTFSFCVSKKLLSEQHLCRERSSSFYISMNPSEAGFLRRNKIRIHISSVSLF